MHQFAALNNLLIGFILIFFFVLTFPVGERLGMGKFIFNITLGNKIPLWVPRVFLLTFGVLSAILGAVEIIRR